MPALMIELSSGSPDFFPNSWACRDFSANHPLQNEAGISDLEALRLHEADTFQQNSLPLQAHASQQKIDSDVTAGNSFIWAQNDCRLHPALVLVVHSQRRLQMKQGTAAGLKGGPCMLDRRASEWLGISGMQYKRDSSMNEIASCHAWGP